MRIFIAGLVAITVSVALCGCGSTKTVSTPSTSASATTSSVTSSGAVLPNSAGPNKTINDYITENKIAETPLKPNEAGNPKVAFPFPPGWSDAGAKTPDWAYGAIAYDNAVDPSDPPSIIAIASKLTGDVDANKILELAPGQLENLPDFKAIGDPEKVTLSGFQGIQSAGTYTYEGKARVVAQKTVVVPASGALFVYQLNADALQGQEGVVLDAAKFIDEHTTITAP